MIRYISVGDSFWPMTGRNEYFEIPIEVVEVESEDEAGQELVDTLRTLDHIASLLERVREVN